MTLQDVAMYSCLLANGTLYTIIFVFSLRNIQDVLDREHAPRARRLEEVTRLLCSLPEDSCMLWVAYSHSFDAGNSCGPIGEFMIDHLQAIKQIPHM